LEFTYKDGKRVGKAVYIWPSGLKEESVYDENGIKSGPGKVTKTDGTTEVNKCVLQFIIRKIITLFDFH